MPVRFAGTAGGDGAGKPAGGTTAAAVAPTSDEGDIVNVGVGGPQQAVSAAMPQNTTKAKAPRERSHSLAILPPKTVAAFCDLIAPCSVSEAPVA
jgi:hypothetical protein